MPPKDVHRSLKLILQILEELPDRSRAGSNLNEMRGLLAGKASGNEGLIIVEAIELRLRGERDGPSPSRWISRTPSSITWAA